MLLFWVDLSMAVEAKPTETGRMQLADLLLGIELLPFHSLGPFWAQTNSKGGSK
jgi:hypothetical protein